MSPHIWPTCASLMHRHECCSIQGTSCKAGREAGSHVQLASQGGPGMHCTPMGHGASAAPQQRPAPHLQAADWAAVDAARVLNAPAHVHSLPPPAKQLQFAQAADEGVELARRALCALMLRNVAANIIQKRLKRRRAGLLLGVVVGHCCERRASSGSAEELFRRLPAGGGASGALRRDLTGSGGVCTPSPHLAKAVSGAGWLKRKGGRAGREGSRTASGRRKETQTRAIGATKGLAACIWVADSAASCGERAGRAGRPLSSPPLPLCTASAFTCVRTHGNRFGNAGHTGRGTQGHAELSGHAAPLLLTRAAAARSRRASRRERRRRGQRSAR